LGADSAIIIFRFVLQHGASGPHHERAVKANFFTAILSQNLRFSKCFVRPHGARWRTSVGRRVWALPLRLSDL
jgi:hypothetical protein